MCWLNEITLRGLESVQIWDCWASSGDFIIKKLWGLAIDKLAISKYFWVLKKGRNILQTKEWQALLISGKTRMNQRRVVSHFQKRTWWALGSHMVSLTSKLVKITHFVFEWHWFSGTTDQCWHFSRHFIHPLHDYFTSALTADLQNPTPILSSHLMTWILFLLRK